ncbi:hypothetical protein [Marinomonas transparens]|uniref:Uncharacterized protein n=1 Tax=Marinomonas transparens TaxID=2795388 RepID=A0A934N1U5_9GAMM|nr:hypothetical protein [Marinomonas transparens]MBJ7539860.1 hypothetical protein [Marinomonas transparens]
MSIEWTLSSGDIKLLAEAVFWVCVIALTPVICKVAYYIITPLWVMIFPAKFVELQYTIDGKQYTATVSTSDNLSEASAHLREVANKKHWKLNE